MPLPGGLGQGPAGTIKRLGQIGDDVVDMLDPHRQPYIARGHAGIALLRRIQL